MDSGLTASRWDEEYGNGRNYVPLVDAGLDLTGLDISPEAIQGLARRRPAQAESLVCADFRRLAPDRRFAYLIAIQVFQHGGDADAAAYFEKVATLLKAGGLFFLRVNSVATQIYHRHTLVEENDFGGLTVRYEDGPKRGLLVHFYSRPELDERTRGGFVPLLAPREDVTVRPAPQTGSWAQWESVWRRLPG